MRTISSCNTITVDSNDESKLVPQNTYHPQLQGRQDRYQQVGALFLSAAIAFTSGVGLAHTEVIEAPAQATAAILHGVSK